MRGNFTDGHQILSSAFPSTAFFLCSRTIPRRSWRVTLRSAGWMLHHTISKFVFFTEGSPALVLWISPPCPIHSSEVSAAYSADGPDSAFVRIRRRAHGSCKILLHATPTQMDIYVALLSFFCFTKPGEYKPACILLTWVFMAFRTLISVRLLFLAFKLLLLFLILLAFQK